MLASMAYDQGQHFIPVHVFPIRFDAPRSVEYLNGLVKDDASLGDFVQQLEPAYYSFQRSHRLPIILIAPDGSYSVGKEGKLPSNAIH